MEEEFKWSDKLVFSERIIRDEYWYTLFRTLFWFPMFKRFVIWYQDEEEAEYYDDVMRKKKIVAPPKKKRKKIVDSDDDSSSNGEEDGSEDDEIIKEYSLETFSEFRMPNQFRPNVEVAFKRDGEEFDFEMKYSLAKMATILTILGSEQYSPDVWKDNLIVSIVDTSEKVLVSTEMTVAALCVCVRFDNFEDFYDIIFDSEKSKSSSIGISSIFHKENPKCFVENLDKTALARREVFEWTCTAGKNSFLPGNSWDTLHGEFTEIKYRARFIQDEENDKDETVISIEKHSIHSEFK